MHIGASRIHLKPLSAEYNFYGQLALEELGGKITAPAVRYKPAAEEVKAIGDALMLRCEDPALAVRLGLRIVRELEEDPDCPPVRVGMHTGPAVFNLITHPRVLDVIEQLIGGEILSNPIQHVRIKPPEHLLNQKFQGKNTMFSATEWHQDQGVATVRVA